MKQGLLEASREGNPTPDQDFQDLDLPQGLSQKEIGDIGIQIACEVESILPSRDARMNGSKVEFRVLKRLGFFALVQEDYITADSIAKHLQKGFGLKGKVVTRTIKRELKKRIPSSIDSFCEDIQAN